MQKGQLSFFCNYNYFLNSDLNFASPAFAKECMAIEEMEAMGLTTLSLCHSCVLHFNK